MLPFRGDDDFTLGNILFDTVKLTKNPDKDKYKYSGYEIGLDNHRNFSLFKGHEFGKNVIILGADMSSSVNVDNKKKYI